MDTVPDPSAVPVRGLKVDRILQHAADDKIPPLTPEVARGTVAVFEAVERLRRGV